MESGKLAMIFISFFISYQFNSFAQVDTTISINPKATYLRINNDAGTLDAIPIDLSKLGISMGDYLLLQQLGDFDNGPGADIYGRLIGVFSANDSLLDPSQAHRVPGAIDAGEDYITPPTYYGSLPTDIPEDFKIDTTTIQVPDSAQFIFISTQDSWYNDNTDPDSDYAVNIKITSPPIKVYGKSAVNILNNYQLYQNYPNPFNPTTTIGFSIPELEFVTLKIYNLLGQEVSTLVLEKLSAGRYEVEWNAEEYPGGIYFFRLTTGGYNAVKKMLLVK